MIPEAIFVHFYMPLLILVPCLSYFLARLIQYYLLKSPGRNVPIDEEMYARGASILLGHSLRQVFAFAMTPVFGFLLRARVNPNTLTLLCFVLSAASGGLIASGAVALGGIVGLLGSSLDYLDGRIARNLGKTTRAGSFLDSTLDRYGEIALVSGAALLFRDSVGTLLACLLSLGSGGVVSYTRAKAEALGIELKVGLMQRPERVVLFCMGTLWSPLLDPFLPARLQGRHLIFAATLYALAFLTTITAAYRTVVGFRTLWHTE